MMISKKTTALTILKKTTLFLGVCLVGSIAHAAQAPAGYIVDQNRVEPEVPERHRYDGITVLREITRLRHWQHPVNPGAPFTDTVRAERDNPIQDHEGRIVVYAIPFRNADGLIARDQRAQYGRPGAEGLYRCRTELNAANKIPFGPLFYRPDGVDGIFHVKVTQQSWERVDGTLVDFLIVSYKQDEKLRFISTASNQENLILNDNLPEPGLYVLVSLENDPTPVAVAQAPGAPAPVAVAAVPVPPANQVPAIIKRWEKWKRLEPNAGTPNTEETEIIIRAASGVMSIPGVGLFARNQIIARGEDGVTRLREMKTAADADVQAILNHQDAQSGAIIITGPTKCGKTTLINCLSRNPCHSRRRADGKGWEYFFPQPIDNLLVGHTSKSQTARPAFRPDPENRTILVDNPGDEDTSGPLIDIINAYMTYKMIQHPSGVKLLLVVDEARIQNDDWFVKALQNVVNSCPHEQNLHNMIHFMVSKHRDIGVIEYLQSLIGNPTADPQIEPNALLEDKPEVTRLIKFLVDHPQRVSVFPMAPAAAGLCHPNIAAVRESLLDGPFVVQPQVGLKIKKSTLHTTLIKEFSQKLNDDMLHFLRTEGAQLILAYCLKQVEDNNRPVSELRKGLKKLFSRLKKIDGDASPEQFIEFFDGVAATATRVEIPKLFDATVMRDIIANLKFLQTLIPEEAKCKVSDWKKALRDTSPEWDTLGKIKALAKAPKVTLADNDNTLCLKGLLIGCSDVEREIASRQINPSKIIIRAFNTWFIDQNMTHNSTCIDAIAPRWKVTGGNKVIDISGRAGDPGAPGNPGINGAGATAGQDGSPGNPGKTAGSFFGKLFELPNPAALIIKANGGQGGNGGNGGIGGAGADAANGQVAAMIEVAGGSGGEDVCIIPWGDVTPQNPQSPWYRCHLWYDVNKRNREVGHLAEWIGHAFTDQTWIFGRVRKLADAPAGGAGMNGGKGGKKGLGGNGGDIVIIGSNAIQNQHNSGTVGANPGSSGNGGQGGTNGLILRATRWTNCKAQNWSNNSQQSFLYNLNDRYHPDEEPTHSAPAQPRSAPGNKLRNDDGTDMLSDTNPAAPDAKVTIDQAAQDTKIAEYRTDYREQAKDPVISPSIRAFPGLE